jgi:hypothetical protein
MNDYATTAEAFIAMAHRIVWCTVATVGPDGAPRTRVLHPVWEWDGERLRGWIATSPTPIKRLHIAHCRDVSLNYWDPQHDTCTAECRATWAFDDETCQHVWNRFVRAPAPVGYDPAIIPEWADGPLSESFAVLQLEPYRLRVFPGSVLMGLGGEKLTWHA